MTSEHFARELMWLTANGRAKWRVTRKQDSIPKTRAYLALGEYRFVLEYAGNGVTLLERGGYKRPPTVFPRCQAVTTLGMLVAEMLGKRLSPVGTLKGEDEVPEAWASLAGHARRVKTVAEEQRDEVELWRRAAGQRSK